MNCDVSAWRMQTNHRSARVRALDKQGSFPPRNRTFDANCWVFSLLVAEQWRDRDHVGCGFRWKWLSCREVLLIARRTCVVSCKEARRSKAIVHLFEIRGTREDVVVRIEGIE